MTGRHVAWHLVFVGRTYQWISASKPKQPTHAAELAGREVVPFFSASAPSLAGTGTLDGYD